MAALPQRHDLLRKGLERFTRLLPGVEAGDVSALHRTRVASRRLRELLPVLQLDDNLARKLGRNLRKITARLGDVRELDVLLIVIDELHESRRQDRAALRRVADDVRRERQRVGGKVLGNKLPIVDLQKIARKLDRALALLEKEDGAEGKRPPPRRGWRWALEARVVRRAGAVRQAIAAAGAVYLPDRLHEVRIKVKKLRYALELSNEAAGIAITPELRRLKRTQELLGRINDLHVLIARIRQIQAALNPPNIAVWRELDALGLAVENSCRRLHGRYMHDRPELEAVLHQLSSRTHRSSGRSGRTDPHPRAVQGQLRRGSGQAVAI
jgi:CHAD domain-containing protein